MGEARGGGVVGSGDVGCTDRFSLQDYAPHTLWCTKPFSVGALGSGQAAVGMWGAVG